MLKIIGADAVGMSTVPEVIVANQLKLKVAAISVLTDECNPDKLEPIDISDIIAMANKAEPQLVELFKSLIKTFNMMSYLNTTKDVYKQAAITPDVGLCCTTNQYGNFPG